MKQEDAKKEISHLSNEEIKKFITEDNTLSVLCRKRAYKFFIENKTYQDIAYEEAVSSSLISMNIEKFLKLILKKTTHPLFFEEKKSYTDSKGITWVYVKEAMPEKKGYYKVKKIIYNKEKKENEEFYEVAFLHISYKNEKKWSIKSVDFWDPSSFISKEEAKSENYCPVMCPNCKTIVY